MSHFEFIAIPVSLIMTFGLARLLGGFPYLLTGRHTYWVHTLWCSTAIVNFLFFWWGFWRASEVADWTLGSYLMTLLYPAACYVGATIFMPADASEQTDWHAYYFRVRRPLFTLAAIATSMNIAILIGGELVPLISPASGLSACFVGLYLVGFFVVEERTHKAIVLVNAALVIAAYAPLIYRPIGS